ncbi:ubiquitin carboxyl-terminal hydrolase, family 1, partial [Melanomma pulvis-pyrius CBS 109.77]
MSTTTVPERTYRKHFIPLESNPEVFTELIHGLGVSPKLAFQDVYSMDDPDLLAFIPRPVYALVLVFPCPPAYDERIAKQEAELEAYDGASEDEPVVFWKQTIHNACGLYALLHGICNGEARKHLAPGSIIDGLIKSCTPLKPEDRALALEGSKELESVYASVASKGSTDAPDAESHVNHHYIGFVKSHKDGHVYHLDGDRKRPVDLGPLGADEDVLGEKAFAVVRDMIASEGGQNLGFSLMALVSE